MTAPVGVAMLGCAHSSHAWAYARALSHSPRTRLVGVYDATPDLAAPIMADFQTPFYPDPLELLGSADVQVAVVCTATVEHRSMVELAASRGCHVLCEKPIATTVEDARAMIQVCRSAQVQLHMAFVTRFHPLVRHVAALIGDGELGDLIAMVGGNRGRPPLPPSYPAWITDAAMSGGGALMDHSVHVTDVMRHLSGREVISVAAEVDARMWDCGVDDIALMSLVFDGGMVASLDPSWSVPAENPWDYDFYLRILGTLGSLSIDDLATSLQLVSRQAGNGLRLVPFGVDIDELMIEAFIESIRTGDVLPPCADGEDGLRALEVALAGYRSASIASPVSLG